MYMTVEICSIFQQYTQKQAEKFTAAFLRSSLPGKSQAQIKAVMQRKAVVLKYTKQKRERKKTKKAKGLNAIQRREMKVFQLKPEHQKLVYFFFHPTENTDILTSVILSGLC